MTGSYCRLADHWCVYGVRINGSMKVLFFALNGDWAGNTVPSARRQSAAPLASLAIETLSGIWNGLTFSRGYGSAMSTGAGTFW